MNKRKYWIPPAAPVQNNLANWIAIGEDIHANMLDAGMIQTSDTGQTPFDDVLTFPGQGEYPVYRMYRWEVDGQPDVYIKLQFGGGFRGPNTPAPATRIPNIVSITVTIGNSTDGSGNFPKSSFVFAYPQDISAASIPGTSGGVPGSEVGQSYYCRNDGVGFFGFVHGAGAHLAVASIMQARASNVAFFLQRDFENESISIMVSGFSRGLGNSINNNEYINYSGFNNTIQTMNLTTGAVINPSSIYRYTMQRGVHLPEGATAVRGDTMFLVPAINTSGRFEVLPGLNSCNQTDIIENAEFQTMVGDELKTFIRLPIGMGIGPGSDGGSSVINMLFDET